MLRIRVTNNQYKRILNKAEALGFSTISAYTRSVLLEDLSSFHLIRKNNLMLSATIKKLGVEDYE